MPKDFATPSDIQPIGIPIADVHRFGGPSRTRAFAEAKAGRLETYRVGRVRMVTWNSLRDLIAQAVAAEKA